MSRAGKSSAVAFFILGALVLAGGLGGFVFLNKDKFFGKQQHPNNTTQFTGLPGRNPDGSPRPPVDRSKWPSDTPLTDAPTLKLPFILWGGDSGTFFANGGVKTKPDSIFAKHGLSFVLVDGNDFNDQVEKYLKNETPFLRGTLSMLAQQCDKLGADPNTRPVVFLQMTWSAGDHMVSRASMKTLADIKGKRIALQKDGPHVGMLDDILRTARLTWNDVKIEWTEDVTGPKGPATKFRDDAKIDACFAITPDMESLTGGLEATGDGKKTTVNGAHVLVSTADMKRSIADVYACRKDFYDANRPLIDRFAAGYLKGCEEILALRREHNKAPTEQYKAVLKMTQDIQGKEAVPSEGDAEGLINDAVFVGLLGNRSFFEDAGNLSGFAFKQKVLMDFVVKQHYASRGIEFHQPDMNYDFIEHLGGLTIKDQPRERFRKNVQLLPQNTIYSFIVSFQPNQSVFPEAQYGQDFERALQQASLFGNAMLAIRGHGDPTFIVLSLLKSGQKQGVIRKKGAGFELSDGTPFDPNNIKQVLEVVQKYPNVYGVDQDSGAEFTDDPLTKEVKYLEDLSQKRADSVRFSVVQFATGKQWRIDESQIQAIGVGPTEPVVTLPKKPDDPLKNMRVEFRIVRVSSQDRIESESDTDF